MWRCSPRTPAGFALVVGVLAVATALASTVVVDRLRRMVPYISRISGALLIAVGAYVAYYGWYEIQLFSAAGNPDDPVIAAAGRVQGAIAGWVHRHEPWPWSASPCWYWWPLGAMAGQNRRENSPRTSGHGGRRTIATVANVAATRPDQLAHQRDPRGVHGRHPGGFAVLDDENPRSGLEPDRPLPGRCRTKLAGITVAPSGVTYGSPNTREVVAVSAAMLSSASGKRMPGILPVSGRSRTRRPVAPRWPDRSGPPRWRRRPSRSGTRRRSDIASSSSSTPTGISCSTTSASGASSSKPASSNPPRLACVMLPPHRPASHVPYRLCYPGSGVSTRISEVLGVRAEESLAGNGTQGGANGIGNLGRLVQSIG